MTSNDEQEPFYACCQTYSGPQPHRCTVYTGPPCKECNRPTLDVQIAAPGYGLVRICRAGHEEELTSCGILRLEDG